jgi:Trk K+ transport system NAD-binding subunit
MKCKNALIFGYNEYSFEIAKNISSHYENIHIFKLEENTRLINKEDTKYEVSSFDLTDDWDNLHEKADIQECVAFCTLQDMAQNIFLTISLRDTFKDLSIIALAKDKESASKLTLAGASRVVPLTQTTANVIVEILKKPVVTEVLHTILYEQSDLQIAQIKVENHHLYTEKYPAEIDWNSEHGIIVISVVHEDNNREFIYSSKAKHHPIKNGDVFIVVGYEKDIVNFEKLIGSRCD